MIVIGVSLILSAQSSLRKLGRIGLMAKGAGRRGPSHRANARLK